jgi:hypothetical protein
VLSEHLNGGVVQPPRQALFLRLNVLYFRRALTPILGYQRDSRKPRSPDARAFCLRYSAQVASARFSSETDFCSFAILMALWNESSIWVSSAPKAARNTPRSRCSSAHHQRSSDISACLSASFIASSASGMRFARYKVSAFSARTNGLKCM